VISQFATNFQLGDLDFDASHALAAALRTAEKNAPPAVATNYDTTLTALDTYFTTVVVSNLRT
jgi:hypothetical protein